MLQPKPNRPIRQVLRVSNPVSVYKNDNQINMSILYYDSLEDTRDKYRETIVEPGDGYRYQGDFYGLLSYLKVDPKLFLQTLYLNNLASPYDYNGEGMLLKIANEVDLIL